MTTQMTARTTGEITPAELIEALQQALDEEPLREALAELNASRDGDR